MNNFATLYRYECKKLLSRKMAWTAFMLCVAAIVLSLCLPLIGGYYVNGMLIDTNYNMLQTDRRYRIALNGRKIDQILLEETIDAYRRIPRETNVHYTLTDEYQQYARPYSAIFNFIHGTTTMQSDEVRLTWRPDEEDLYARRQTFLMGLLEEKALSDEEILFWKSREAQILKPFVYEEHEAYAILLSAFQTVGLLTLLFISISLSGVFFDEHARKTDQMILCCPLGKATLYGAKIAAGVSFSVASAIALFAAVLLTTFCLYGTAGYGAAFQLIYTRSLDPITCGQAIGIAYGCMIAAAAVAGVVVMVLSELLRSNMAALAVSTGLLILAMIISIPEQYRVIAQIWDWLPWSFLAPWNVFNRYTMSLFGRHFAPWQIVPVLYLMTGFLIAFAGKGLYNRYQVGGR